MSFAPHDRPFPLVGLHTLVGLGLVLFGPLLTHAQEAALPAASRAAEDGFLADELRRVDASEDGWDTEVFHDQIKPLLHQWVAPLAAREWDGAVIEAISPSLQAAPLRPSPLSDLTVAGGFTVRRPAAPLSQNPSITELQPAVAAWLRPFAPDQPVDIHLKIFRVALQGNRALSGVYVDVTGPAAVASGAGEVRGTVQQNITWKITWSRPSDTDPWQMDTLVLAEFEELEAATAEPLFTDLTVPVVGATEAWREQLRFGMDHWRLRLETALAIEPGGINGMALGDANGDGLEDLFYTDSGGLPKRLFLHQPDGSLTDVTREAGLDFLDRSRAALFADLDNDGDQDLILGLEDQLLMLRNDGRARFTRGFSVPAAARVHGLAAADYDRDGLVDIYACSYGRDFSTFGEEGVPLPWDDAQNGAPNALFRNEGNWRFANATRQAGLETNNNRFSFAACWEDVDRDGWIDLYVANDFGRNNFYRNEGGKFTDIASAAGIEDRSPGMACSWGDVNGDGHMDLQVSNMFSGAGNRITFQPNYKEGSQADVIANHQRFARGNSLFINRGNGSFSDESVSTGITLGRWAWGHQMADINNDGMLDSLVGNGFITGPEEDDL